MYPQFQFDSPDSAQPLDVAGTRLSVGDVVQFIRPAGTDSILHDEENRTDPHIAYRVLDIQVLAGNEAWLAQVDYNALRGVTTLNHWFMAAVYVAAELRDPLGRLQELSEDPHDTHVPRRSRFRRWLPAVCVQQVSAAARVPVFGEDYSVSRFEALALRRDTFAVKEGLWATRPTAQVAQFVLEHPVVRTALAASLNTRRKVTPDKVRWLVENDWPSQGLRLDDVLPGMPDEPLLRIPVDHEALARFFERLAQFGQLSVPARACAAGFTVGKRARQFLAQHQVRLQPLPASAAR